MHGLHSTSIQSAFDRALQRACASTADEEAFDFTSEQVEEDFYALPDLMYDTESYVSPDTIEVAFDQGQKYPNQSRYTCWWGNTVCWFIGTEEDILTRLDAFQA